MSDEINKGRKVAGPRQKLSVKVGKRVAAKITGNKMAERAKQQKYRMYRSENPAEAHSEWVKSNIDNSILKGGMTDVIASARDAVKNYAKKLLSPSSKPDQNIKDVLPQRYQPEVKKPITQDPKSIFKPKVTIGVEKNIDPQGLTNMDFKTRKSVVKKALPAIIAGAGKVLSAIGGGSRAMGALNVASSLMPSGNKEEISTDDPAVKCNGGDVETIVRANVKKILDRPFEKSAGETPTLMKPFVSEAQRSYMHINHPEIADRWEKETPEGKLPYKVKKG